MPNPSNAASTAPSSAAPSQLIDPRGPRFAAAVTAVVLAVVLLTGNAWLLAAQAVVFALGAFAGLQYSPYSVVYRRVVRPRLAPPAELEASAPPRFAQGVGFAFALDGTIALALDATTAGLIAVGLALGAAFLNAAFGFCLGCEMYLIGRRVLSRTASQTDGAAASAATATHSGNTQVNKEVAA
jgi:hypothetical protein